MGNKPRIIQKQKVFFKFVCKCEYLEIKYIFFLIHYDNQRLLLKKGFMYV